MDVAGGETENCALDFFGIPNYLQQVQAKWHWRGRKRGVELVALHEKIDKLAVKKMLRFSARSSLQQHSWGPEANPLSTGVSSVFICKMVKFEWGVLQGSCLPDPHPDITQAPPSSLSPYSTHMVQQGGLHIVGTQKNIDWKKENI